MGAMNRINLSKLTSDDMGRYLESPDLRGVGGSHFWSYFFFSLLFGDYINWGGGSSNLGIKDLLLIRDIFIQKWYTMD